MAILASALMTNPHMASDFKRAHAPCPDLLAVLTRLQESGVNCDPSKRANARRSRLLARRLWTELAFGSRVRFILWFHHPAWRPADAPNPSPPVGHDRRKAGRDSAANGDFAILHDWNESIACHAVEALCFPGRRPFRPGVHPTLRVEVSVRIQLGSGAITPVQILHLLSHLSEDQCGRRRRSNPSEQVLNWAFRAVSEERLTRRDLSSSLQLHHRPRVSWQRTSPHQRAPVA